MRIVIDCRPGRNDQKVLADTSITEAYLLKSEHWLSKGYWIEYKEPVMLKGYIIEQK